MNAKKRSLALPKGEKKPAVDFTFRQQQLATENAEKENTRICCHLCGLDISRCSFDERNTHVNDCADKICCQSDNVVSSASCGDSDFVDPVRFNDSVITSDHPNIIELYDDERDVEMACALSLSGCHSNPSNPHSYDARGVNAKRKRRPPDQSVTIRRKRPLCANDLLMRSTRKSTAPTVCVSGRGGGGGAGGLVEVEEALCQLRCRLNDIEESMAKEEYRKVQIQKEVKRLMKRQLQLEMEHRQRRAGQDSPLPLPPLSLEEMVCRVFPVDTTRTGRGQDGDRKPREGPLAPLWRLSQMRPGFDELVGGGTAALVALTVPSSAPPRGTQGLAPHRHPYFASRVSSPTPLPPPADSSPLTQPHPRSSPSALSQLLSALQSQQQPVDVSTPPQVTNRAGRFEFEDPDDVFAAMQSCLDYWAPRCANESRCLSLWHKLQRTCQDLRSALRHVSDEATADAVGEESHNSVHRAPASVGAEWRGGEGPSADHPRQTSPSGVDIICLDLDDLIVPTPTPEGTRRRSMSSSGDGGGCVSDMSQHDDNALTASPFNDSGPPTASSGGQGMLSPRHVTRRSSRRVSGASSLVHVLTPSSAPPGRASLDSGTLSIWAAAATSQLFSSATPMSEPPQERSRWPVESLSPSSPPERNVRDDSDSGVDHTAHVTGSFDGASEGVVHFFGDGPCSPLEDTDSWPLSPVMRRMRRDSVEPSNEDVHSTRSDVRGQMGTSDCRRVIAAVAVKQEALGSAPTSPPVITSGDSIPHVPVPGAVPEVEERSQILFHEETDITKAAPVQDTHIAAHRRFDIIALATVPNFSDYSDVELKQICKSYGIKQSASRKFMTEVLLGLWERSHSNAAGGGGVACRFIESTDGSGAVGGAMGEEGEIGEDEDTSLSQAVLEYIRNYDVDMYEKVLSFQPLNIDDVRAKLRLHGVQVSKVSLRSILDKEGIFVSCI